MPQTGKRVKRVVNVKTDFTRSPRTSARRASRESQLSDSAVHDIVHKRLPVHSYKTQIRQYITPNDRRLRAEFAIEMLSYIDEKIRILILSASLTRKPSTSAEKRRSATAEYGGMRTSCAGV